MIYRSNFEFYENSKLNLIIALIQQDFLQLSENLSG